jgi:actin-related protein
LLEIVKKKKNLTFQRRKKTNFLKNSQDPRVKFPAIIGRVDKQNLTLGMKDTYIGDEVTTRREKLNVTTPIQRGIITNFEDMEEIYHHLYHVEVKKTFSHFFSS